MIKEIKDGKVLKIEVSYTNKFIASCLLDGQTSVYEHTHFKEAILGATKHWKRKTYRCPKCNNNRLCIDSVTIQTMKDGEIIELSTPSYSEQNHTECTQCGYQDELKDFTC